MTKDDFVQEIRHLTPEEQEAERIGAEMGREIPWLTVKDVCQRLLLSSAQVYRYCRKRKIPFHKVGNRLLFLEWELFRPEVIRRIWHWLGRPLTVSPICMKMG